MAEKKKTAKKTELKRGKVFGGNLNVRKQPGYDAGVIGYMENGAEIEILEDLGDWLRIADGYVAAKWVEK